MGAAWRGPSQVGKGQWQRVLGMVAEIRAMDMEVCTTLGMLTPEQARPEACSRHLLRFRSRFAPWRVEASAPRLARSCPSKHSAFPCMCRLRSVQSAERLDRVAGSPQIDAEKS